MKKGLIYRILLCVVLAVAAIPLSAQRYDYAALYQADRPSSKGEMGLSLAGAYMMATPSIDLVQLRPRIGVRGALSMAMCWHESYALQLELAYIYNKIEAQRANMEFDVKSGVMEIPIMFSYRGLWPLRLNVGPVLSIAGTARYDLAEERIEFGRLRPTLGLAVGVGVNLSHHLVLEARYSSGFVGTDNYFEGLEFSTRSHWLTLGIGYMF